MVWDEKIESSHWVRMGEVMEDGNSRQEEKINWEDKDPGVDIRVTRFKRMKASEGGKDGLDNEKVAARLEVVFILS
jgi:hypothetical protein